jgi:hypothetical protein
MDEELSRQILDALFPALEAQEAQATALLQCLKEKEIVTDEELTPYLEQAANASNVRWRAARVRLDYLLSSAAKLSGREAEKQSAEPPDRATASAPQTATDERSEDTGNEKTSPAEGKKTNTEPPVNKDKNKDDNDKRGR